MDKSAQLLGLFKLVSGPSENHRYGSPMVSWIIKNIIIALFWLAILSIEFGGKPLFYTAHDLVIDNRVVQAVDQQARKLWANLTSNKEVFSNSQQGSDKDTF